MPEKNPLTGKRTRATTAPPNPSNSPGGGLVPSSSSQIGNFSDTIALPYPVPVHDINNLIPSDIYDPGTSSAPRLKRDEADRRIEIYGEMVAAQEVAEAGYSFVSSVFKTHTSYQRALGDGFSALRETLATQRKQVSAATATVDLSTERLKFARSVQLNQQANIKLTGETTKTGLAQDRVDAELLKLKNEIQGLKTKAQQALLAAQSLELPT
jgi:hypothetical protein